MKGRAVRRREVEEPTRHLPLPKGRWPARGAQALLALAAVLLALGPPGRASAHASLERADPAPGAVLQESPTQIKLRLTEAVDPRFSSVDVLTSGGERVPTGTLQQDPGQPAVISVAVEPLPDGAYAVSWQALSIVDGHQTRGVYRFAIGDQAAAGVLSAPVRVSPPYPWGWALLRWPFILSVLAATGGYLFWLLVYGVEPAAPEARGVLERHWSRFRLGSVGALLASNVVVLLVQVAQVGPPWEPTGYPLVLDTRWGRVWLARTGLILALALVALLLGARAPGPRWRAWLLEGTGLVLCFALLASLTLVSHSAAGSLPALGIPVDFAHLVAGSAWVGGLAAFLVVGLPGAWALGRSERSPFLAALALRFSRLALLSAGVLWLSGAAAGWLRVGSWGALFGTQYGLTLVVKLALVLLLSLGGLVNLLYTRPRLEPTRSPEGPEGGPALLARVLRFEVLAAVAVLLAVGALTWVTPGRDDWALRPHSLVLERSVEDLHLRVEVSPGGLAPNTYAVRLRDPQGPVVSAEVELRFAYLEWDFSPEPVTLTDLGNGHYTGEGTQLGIAGWWNLRLLVQRPGAFDTRTAFHFRIPVDTKGDPVARLPRLQPTLGWGTRRSLLVAVLGFLLLGLGWRSRGFSLAVRSGVLLLGATAALTGSAVAMVAQIAPEAPRDIYVYRDLRNPVLPKLDSIFQGYNLYRAQCLSCHGPTFRADGPQAAGLIPPPADLTIHAFLHEEGELFAFIANGVPRTAMRSYRGILTEEEMWHIVNYIGVSVAPHH